MLFFLARSYQNLYFRSLFGNGLADPLIYKKNSS